MRRLFVMAVLLAGAGCQAFGPRCDGDTGPRRRPACNAPEQPEAAPKKPAAPEQMEAPPKKAAAPETLARPAEAPRAAAPYQPADTAMPAIAQDVLLVPKVVYMPYVAHTPTAPMRLSAGLPAPAAPEAPQEAPAVPRATPRPPEDRKLEKKCQELCDRVIYLEKCLRERPPVCAPPAAPECPPAARLPLLRGLLQRSDPCLQSCEPAQPCAPGAAPAPTQRSAPESIAPPRAMPAGSAPRPAGSTGDPLIVIE